MPPRKLDTGENIPVVGITQLPNVEYAGAAASRAATTANALKSLAHGMEIVGDVAFERHAKTVIQRAELAGYEAGGSGEDFQPIRKPGLIYEAYNRAGLATYEARLRASAKTTVAEIALKHRNDPLQMEKAVNEYRAGVEGTLPTELKATYRANFQTLAQPYIHSAHVNALERAEKSAKDAAKADAMAASDVARAMGGFSAQGDPRAIAQADAALGSAIGGIIANQAQAIQSGFQTPGGAQLFLQETTGQLAKDYLEGFVIGSKDKSKALADVVSGKLRTMFPVITEQNGQLVTEFREISILEAVPLKDQRELMASLHSAVNFDRENMRFAREEARHRDEMQLRADLRAVAVSGDPVAAARVRNNPWASGSDINFVQQAQVDGRTDPSALAYITKAITLGQTVTPEEVWNLPLSRHDREKALAMLDAYQNEKHWSKGVPFTNAAKIATDNLVGFIGNMVTNESERATRRAQAVGAFLDGVRVETDRMFAAGYSIGHLPAGQVVQERPDGTRVFSPENWTRQRLDELRVKVDGVNSKLAPLEAAWRAAQARMIAAQAEIPSAPAAEKAKLRAEVEAKQNELKALSASITKEKKSLIDVLSGAE